jgi:hypothetical protein
MPLEGASRKPVVLPAVPARAVRLCLASFPEFGAHTVSISAALDPGTSLLAIDLLPEAQPETPANLTTLAFTPARPTREWSWFAPSPFAPGYRWRRHVDGRAPLPWSDVQSPFSPLRVSELQMAEASP